MVAVVVVVECVEVGVVECVEGVVAVVVECVVVEECVEVVEEVIEEVTDMEVTDTVPEGIAMGAMVATVDPLPVNGFHTVGSTPITTI